jgi:hypothetical protein
MTASLESSLADYNENKEFGCFLPLIFLPNHRRFDDRSLDYGEIRIAGTSGLLKKLSFYFGTHDASCFHR